MAIVRGVLFGFGLCLLALFLFIVIGGMAGLYATRQIQSEIEEGIARGTEDGPPAAREFVRHNGRVLTRAALYGDAQFSEDEQRERRRGYDELRAEMRRRFEQRRQGTNVDNRSGRPMQSARPMVDPRN